MVRLPTTVLAQNDSGRRREERRQRLRRQELPRHLRAAVRRHQRLALPRDAARDGTPSPAWPRRSRSRSSAMPTSSAGSSANAAALAACEPAPLAELIRRSRRAAPRPHRRRRRSVRARQRAPARLRPLGGAQAGVADPQRAAARRGGRHRHRARQPLYSAEAGLLAAAGRASRILGLLERLGFVLWHDGARAGTRRRPAVLDGLDEFREHLGGELTITLLRRRRARRRGPRRSGTSWSCAALAVAAPPPGSPAMKLAAPGAPHLTYCTNIHAGRDLGRGARQPRAHVLAVKSAVAPDRPFGVGLRLSAEAAADASRARMRSRRSGSSSTRHGLYVFTINGFPYGPFHGTRGEGGRLPARLAGRRAAHLHGPAGRAARRAPAATAVSRAASARCPGASRPRVPARRDVARDGRAARPACRDAVAGMRERTGKPIVARPRARARAAAGDHRRGRRASSRSTSSRPARLASFAALTGLGRGESEAALRRHLGVCLDACHAAVEFEDAAAGAGRAARRRASGSRKIQISAGLRVALDPGPRAVAALRPLRRGRLPAPGRRAPGRRR